MSNPRPVQPGSPSERAMLNTLAGLLDEKWTRGDEAQRQVDRGQAEQDREDWNEIRRNR